MSVLFDAMGHACDAGRHAEALEAVYRRRVLQGFTYFSTDRLGAYGAGLGALAGFFDVRWTEPVAGLPGPDRACVLHEAAVHLLGVGRPRDALAPFRRAAELYAAEGMFDYASPSARYLGEIHLMLGEIPDALGWAETSIEFADRAGDRFEQMADRFGRGDVLHQAGRLEEAEAAFIEAERVTDAEGKPIPNLFFFWELPHCELLVTMRRPAEAEARARHALALEAQTKGSLLATAQIHLALASALVARLELDGDADAASAARHVDEALDRLRQATHQVHLPRGLLGRATLRRRQGDLAGAQADLAEALRIAGRSDMALAQADGQLVLAELCRARGDRHGAREAVRTARSMIDRMGYRRRDPEVARLEAVLG